MSRPHWQYYQVFRAFSGRCVSSPRILGSLSAILAGLPARNPQFPRRPSKLADPLAIFLTYSQFPYRYVRSFAA